MATRMETQSDFLEYMGVASLLGGDVHSFDDLASAIDKVTVADVEEVSVTIDTAIFRFKKSNIEVGMIFELSNFT